MVNSPHHLKQDTGALKGRGAISNRDGRFEATQRESFDDGWQQEGQEEASPFITTLEPDRARTVITRNDSPDIPFEQSLNPYRGCEHGCIYCFARPTHAWLGLSPGLDFETRLFFKPEAPRLLEAALSKPAYRCQPIALGSNTDPYQPVERQQRLTRRVLEVMAEFSQPVGIITKSALVTRDIDLLAPMAQKRLAAVCVSVTSLDGHLARVMEPRASSPHRRLEAIRQLSAAGIPVAVLTSPLIPGLNDHEIEYLLEAAAAAGASSASYVLLRLPLEIGPLFEEWLGAHFPDRQARVLSLMKQCRGGALYDPRFGHRMVGDGPYAQQIRARYKLAKKRNGLTDRAWQFDTGLFRRPPRAGEQLSFL
jgi:DNA repair photolyase